MNATAMVSRDSVCGASLKPYTECPGNHRHAFTDPEREGKLLAGWATLHEPDEHKMTAINVWWAELTR